jgi:hypothetical protein
LEEKIIDLHFKNSEFLKENVKIPWDITKAVFASCFKIEDGEVRAYDPKTGAQMLGQDFNPISFDDGLKRIIEADQRAATFLKGKEEHKEQSASFPVAAGGQGNGGQGDDDKKIPAQVNVNTMSKAEKLAYMSKYGQEAYLDLVDRSVLLNRKGRF